MKSLLSSIATSTFSAGSAEFATVNRRLWQMLLLNFVFDILLFVVVGHWNGRTWPQVLIQALPPALLFTAVLWLFFSRSMFHRRYVISPAGVSLFHRGSLQQHITWAEVSHITRKTLSIHAHDGRSITFCLPIIYQRQAEQIVNACR